MWKNVGIELTALSCPEKLEGRVYLNELFHETMKVSEARIAQKGILEEKR